MQASPRTLRIVAVSDTHSMHRKVSVPEGEVTLEGIKFHGTPWQPWFFDWAFNLPRGEALREKWSKIPGDTDILLTHSPPFGHGDRPFKGDRAGCEDLLRRVWEVRPRLHVFGHIHEGYGMTSNPYTTFVNASICTLEYNSLNGPVVFDYVVGGPEEDLH